MINYKVLFWVIAVSYLIGAWIHFKHMAMLKEQTEVAIEYAIESFDQGRVVGSMNMIHAHVSVAASANNVPDTMRDWMEGCMQAGMKYMFAQAEDTVDYWQTGIIRDYAQITHLCAKEQMRARDKFMDDSGKHLRQ